MNSNDESLERALTPLAKTESAILQPDNMNNQSLEPEPLSATSANEPKSPAISQVSQTSTLEYGHVSFEQYRVQVKQLCHTLWPSSKKPLLERLLGGPSNKIAGVLRAIKEKFPSSSQDFLIERLKGGSYNRVIGITILHQNSDPIRLILRVPRLRPARPDRESAMLRFVSQHTQVPVPEVKSLDLTSENPLGEPYMIQSRVPGHDLQHDTTPSYYPALNHEQKCVVVRDLARVLLDLQHVTHPSPGFLEVSKDVDDCQSFTVHPFELEGSLGLEAEPDLNMKLRFLQSRPYEAKWEPEEVPPFEQRTYYFMLAQFGRWKALELRCDPASIGWMHHYDRLVKAAAQMDGMGVFGNDQHCLCHLDLNAAPRNIMADIDADNTLRISGILDWDSAVFAPKFVGCTPPMWIWAWNSEGDEDERRANDLPDTPEQQELKRLFEEEAGPEFCMFAYLPEYRLAREMFRFALHGVHFSQNFAEIEQLLEEWEALYASFREDRPEVVKESGRKESGYTAERQDAKEVELCGNGDDFENGTAVERG